MHMQRIQRCRRLLHVEFLEARTLLDAATFPTPLELADTQPFTATEVVARVHSSTPVESLLAARPELINAATTRILFGRQGSFTVQVGLAAGVDPRIAVRRLDALPFVEWASPNFIYHKVDAPTPAAHDYVPNDPRYVAQYHHPLMQNNGAWDFGFGHSSIVVAVTDDGVDLYHQDLYENIWINPGEIPSSRIANLVDSDGDGVLTFRDLNRPENRGPFKVNDTNADNVIDARDLLAPMQMSGDVDLGGGGWANRLDDGGNGYVDDVVGWATDNNTNNPHPIGGSTHGTHCAGIVAARTDNGVGVAGTAGDVTIMPIRWTGGGSWTSTVIAASYAYAANNGARIISTSYTVDQFVNDPIFRSGLEYMYDLGVLHINSAGNQGQANRDRLRLDTTLYVANTDRNDRKNSSSNWGWGMDISAPGTDILSTTRNNTYSNLTGTSMSAPNVAGVAAMLWSLVPDMSREELVARLLGTADDIDALNPQYAGQMGTGRVNSFRMLSEEVVAPRFRAVNGLPAEGGSTGGQLRNFTIDLRHVFYPDSIHEMSNWEMREAGADGTFDTEDDVFTPLTLSVTIGNTYRVGTNRLYFATPNALPPGAYRFRAVSGGLMDPFGQGLDGNGDGVGGDSFDRHFFVVGAAPGQGGGDRLQVIDLLLPVTLQEERIDGGNSLATPAPFLVPASFTAPREIVWTEVRTVEAPAAVPAAAWDDVASWLAIA